MSVDKFGRMEEDDNKIITPFHSHQTNLDDLENVEGFNDSGNRNAVYGYRLNGKGIYSRIEIKLPEDLKLFDDDNAEKDTPLNIIFQKGKWKLINSKHNWDIDIRIKNNTVSCHGDTVEVLRIFNSGKIFGNLVPIQGVYDDTTNLIRHHGSYFIGSSKKKGITGLEFKAKFENDIELLKDPPNGSTFYISGYLLNNKENESIIIEGLNMKIENLDNPKPFWIMIRKNKNDFTIKHSPEELKLDPSADINLNKIKIYYDKYIIDRISFTKSKILNDEILFL